MAYIIDKTNPEFSDVPATLEGEVLMERTYGDHGHLSGFITASLDMVRSMKGKTDAELDRAGWLKYKDIINAIQ